MDMTDNMTIEEDTDYDDVMSEYGSCYYSGSDNTTSIASETTNFKFENGRRYHAYSEGHYWGPNDEQQNAQLELFDQIYYLMLEDLYLAPIKSPKCVLDLGTGTGVWAIAMADAFPGAKILGNDLSPVQPTWLPANCSFEVDDFTKPWVHPPRSFDFIHARDLHGSVFDWPEMLSRAFQALIPGGYYESVELEPGTWSDVTGELPDNSPVKQWFNAGIEAGRKSGRRIDIAGTFKPLMERRGFVNVVERCYKVPIGPWAKDRRMKIVGKWMLVNLLEAAEGFSLALFTRHLGLSVEEAKKMVNAATDELMNKKLRLYCKIYVTYGQRPVDEVMEVDSAYFSASSVGTSL